MKYIALLVMVCLAGCATSGYIDSSVTRYHKMTKQQDGSLGTYAFFIPSEQKLSLEYENFVSLAKEQLNAHGMRESTNPKAADYTAVLSYLVSAGDTTTTTMVAPMQAAGSGSFAAGFNMATAAGGYSASSNSSYVRRIAFSLLKSDGGNPQTYYDSKLRSEGSNSEISIVMPTLMKALFDGFPGVNGESREIRLPWK